MGYMTQAKGDRFYNLTANIHASGMEGVYSVDGILPATIAENAQSTVGIAATEATSGEFSIAQFNVHNLSLAVRF